MEKYLKPLAAALVMGLSTSVMASAGPVAGSEESSTDSNSMMEGINFDLLGNSAAMGHAAKNWFEHVAFGGSAQVNVVANDESVNGDGDTYLRLQNANFSALASMGMGWNALVNYAYVDSNAHSATDVAASNFSNVSVQSGSEFDQALVSYDGRDTGDITMIAGLGYGRFGTYDNPYASLMSLSQGLEQFNTYLVDFGMRTPYGVFSLGAYEDEDQSTTTDDDRVNGFTVNYAGERMFGEANVKFHASYLNDYSQVLDADSVYAGLYWMRMPAYTSYYTSFEKYVGAFSSHVNVDVRDMHFGFDYDRVSDDMISGDSQSQPYTWGVNAGYDHMFMGKDAHVNVAFEKMYDADHLFTADQRIALNLSMDVQPNVVTGVEFATYDITSASQNISSLELDDTSSTVMAFAKVVF